MYDEAIVGLTKPEWDQLLKYVWDKKYNFLYLGPKLSGGVRKKKRKSKPSPAKEKRSAEDQKLDKDFTKMVQTLSGKVIPGRSGRRHLPLVVILELVAVILLLCIPWGQSALHAGLHVSQPYKWVWVAYM